MPIITPLRSLFRKEILVFMQKLKIGFESIKNDYANFIKITPKFGPNIEVNSNFGI